MDFACWLGIGLKELGLSQPIQVTTIDVRTQSTGHVNHHTIPLSLHLRQHETLELLVTTDSSSIILSHPWLLQHDPLNSWTSNRILQWGLTSIHPFCIIYLLSPINLTCMLLDFGRKPEHAEETHTYTGIACKLHTKRYHA